MTNRGKRIIIRRNKPINKGDKMGNQTAFDKIMGDCAGVNIMALTADDIRQKAEYWNSVGEYCSEDQLSDAIRYLEYCQEMWE